MTMSMLFVKIHNELVLKCVLIQYINIESLYVPCTLQNKSHYVSAFEKHVYIYIYVDIFEQNWKTPTMIVLNCISVSLVLKPQLAAYLPVTQIYRTTYSYCTNHPLFTRYSHSSQGSGFNQKLNIYVYMTTWTYFSILTKK